MVGWGCFSPVTSRVSPRRASYFFLLRQKKVTKKKASHVRAASRSLALLAAFGTLANSLRSNSASVLIRTLLRCSARPNGGGYLSARPLRELRPGCSFASLTSRELGCLISHKARHAVPLRPHSSLLRPNSSILTPHSSVNQSSIPRCAGIPAANACLTIFISVTVSASATISSGQRRPVSTTCTCAGRFCKVTSTSSSGSQP